MTHDPGGKVRLKIDDRIASYADITTCGRWRRKLVRDWTHPGQEPRTILWIGMNPSTADSSHNDPTVAREISFSRTWGFTRYLKGNVLDWRATFPGDIPKDRMLACTEKNLEILKDMAKESDMIMAAWGKLPPAHQSLTQDIVKTILDCGKIIHCLGMNLDGSPKHPLYLKKTLTPLPYFQKKENLS